MILGNFAKKSNMNKLKNKENVKSQLHSEPILISEGTKIFSLQNSSEFSFSSPSRVIRFFNIRKLMRSMKDIEPGDTIVLSFESDVIMRDWSLVSEHPGSNAAPIISVETFRNIFESAIISVKSLMATPIIMTLSPIEVNNYLNTISQGLDSQNILRWLGWNKETLSELHEEYNMELYSLAKKTGTTIFDLKKVIPAGDDLPKFLESNGYRLSKEGKRFVEDAILAIRL